MTDQSGPARDEAANDAPSTPNADPAAAKAKAFDDVLKDEAFEAGILSGGSAA